MKQTILCVMLAVLAVFFTGCGNQPTTTKSKTEAPAAAPTTPAKTDTLAAKPADTTQPAAKPTFDKEPPLKKFDGKPKMTVNVKGYGTIRIELDPSVAPFNVSNVYQLAAAGFYDGLIFHRIVPGFVIQGGDPTGTGGGGPPYQVKAEIKAKHMRGAVAMARTGDQVNPEKKSSSCQFYIALKDLPNLDAGGYTVIGKVLSGMDVVDNIAKVERDPRDKPLTPVVMEKVTVEEK